MYSDTLIKTELPRRTRWNGLLVPAVVGLIAGPMIIVAHETGHYLAAIALGIEARLQYGMVHMAATADRMKETDFVTTASGPMTTRRRGSGRYMHTVLAGRR